MHTLVLKEIHSTEGLAARYNHGGRTVLLATDPRDNFRSGGGEGREGHRFYPPPSLQHRENPSCASASTFLSVPILWYLAISGLSTECRQLYNITGLLVIKRIVSFITLVHGSRFLTARRLLHFGTRITTEDTRTATSY